jgi:hypothetical protein
METVAEQEVQAVAPESNALPKANGIIVLNTAAYCGISDYLDFQANASIRVPQTLRCGVKIIQERPAVTSPRTFAINTSLICFTFGDSKSRKNGQAQHL